MFGVLGIGVDLKHRPVEDFYHSNAGLWKRRVNKNKETFVFCFGLFLILFFWG